MDTITQQDIAFIKIKSDNEITKVIDQNQFRYFISILKLIPSFDFTIIMYSENWDNEGQYKIYKETENSIINVQV